MPASSPSVSNESPAAGGPAAGGPAAGAPATAALDGFMEAAGDIVFLLDRAGTIRAASARTRRMIGAAGVGGMALVELVAETERLLVCQAVRDAQTGEPALAEVRLLQGAGECWYELRIGPLPGRDELLAVGRDLSAQRATEERLRHMATHDALTELPNRLLLSDRIRMVIAGARRTGQGFAVATIGLDGFKKVNDGLGHACGDAVLRLAAIRLRKTLRDSDTLARVGGDEFVAVLAGTYNAAQIKLVTGRLMAVLQSPFDIEKQTVYLGASIGVAVYPDHAEDDVQLLALADGAMGRAKETGKGRVEVHCARPDATPRHDLSLEAAMFHAVREGEFQLYYQPIVSGRTRQIEGFETLMRWKHPTLGMVPPNRFIPIAETNGLINLLGAWALKAALVQIRQFEEVAGRDLYVSVNISPRQFRSDRFLGVLDDALAFSSTRGDKLVLEITEGTLMVDPVQAEVILTRMAERRARIAIDDFGTGYSSLAYLKRFPISVLKIDRAFIKDLPADTKDAAICNAVLDLAKHLDLAVVAEGVETEEQFAYVATRGCDYIQGYLTGKPMPAHVAIAALKENRYAALMPGELRAGQS
jgi:diguanylate cyclase (GGDEF)-like protein